MYAAVLTAIVLNIAIATAAAVVLVRLARYELFSLAAMFGTGAYVYGVLTVHSAWSIPAATSGALIAGAALGLAVYWLGARLGDGELLATSLSLQLSFQALLTAWVPVTGGPTGLPRLPRLVETPLELVAVESTILLIIVLSYQAARQYGLIGAVVLAFSAESLAQSTAIYTTRYRIVAVCLASVILAAAGTLQVQISGVASPESFGMSLSLSLYLAAIFMGPRVDLLSAFAASAIFVLLPEAFRSLGMATATSVAIRDIALGAFLVLAASSIARNSRGRSQVARDAA